MKFSVVVLVLCSGLMHALWNTLLQMGNDRTMVMAVVTGIMALFALILLPFGPAPDPSSWPYIFLSAALNNAYIFFLIKAYRYGDLSHSYPLARGSAPLLVAIGAALFVGERLSTIEIVGVGLISGGIVSLLFGGNNGLNRSWRSLFYPLGTGLLIATYTVVDGVGVRLSGNPTAYVGWLFILLAIPINLFTFSVRRRDIVIFFRNHGKAALLAGLLSFSSYALAIWALNLGAMAHVAALRETSVIMAAIIGSRFLGDPFGRLRILASSAVALGVVIMNLQI